MTRKILFPLAIAMMICCVFALTIGQWLPVEFRSARIRTDFYYSIIILFPLAVLLTLTRTVRNQYDNRKKVRVIAGTFAASIISLWVIYNVVLHFAWGRWINESIVYRHKENPERTINTQLYDVGALGYRGRRVVELQPFTPLFYVVKTTGMEKPEGSQWQYVNEDGDIKMP